MHVYDPFARRQRISISLEKAITAVPHTNDDKVTQRRILLTQPAVHTRATAHALTCQLVSEQNCLCLRYYLHW